MLRLICLLGIFAAVSAISVKKVANSSAEWELSINMPGKRPLTDEEYVCMAKKVPRKGYAVAFRPTAHADRVHHMILFGCLRAGGNEGELWNCESGGGPCAGGLKILYAWARNAPPLVLPDDVGAPIGFDGDVEYLVLQVHYAKKFDGMVSDYTGVTLDMISQEPKGLSGVYLFVAGMRAIPPHQDTVYMNMSCPYRGEADLHPFAFRTHTHALGGVVSAALRRDGQWKIIGKRNPQWPQLFQMIREEDKVVIRTGDVLAGQCRFNSTTRDETTGIGMHGKNEMCNFYMMYWRDAKSKNPFKANAGCGNEFARKVFQTYPAEASAPLPVNPQLEHVAHQSGSSFGVVEKARWTKAGKLEFGEISGFSLDTHGNIVVFHRGGHVWNGRTFKAHNELRVKEAIEVDTVVTVDSSTGKFVSSWGKDRFYLPHGITVDSRGNVWLTDVGLHQVLRFVPKNGVMTEDKVWGEQFIPGSDRTHFCKPAAVAVASDGSFYVADGYCNSRIVVFSADGSYRDEYGTRSQDVNPPLGTFYLPHDIVLNEEKKELIISDRENGRVQVMHINGTPLYAVKPPDSFLTVYSSDYCKARKTIFMIPGTSPRFSGQDIEAFAASPITKHVAYSWKPTSGKFLKPHILRVSADCRYVFVGEIRPLGGILWKFEIESESTADGPAKTMAPEPTSKMRNKNRKPGVLSPSEPEESPKKAATLGPEKHTVRKVVLYLTTAIGIPALLFLLICACLRFRKHGGGLRTMNMMSVSDGYFKDKSFGKTPLLFGGRSHKGFQPLNTEDIDGIDDLTDESDAEDTLYPPKRNFEPLNA